MSAPFCNSLSRKNYSYFREHFYPSRFSFGRLSTDKNPPKISCFLEDPYFLCEFNNFFGACLDSSDFRHNENFRVKRDSFIYDIILKRETKIRVLPFT